MKTALGFLQIIFIESLFRLTEFPLNLSLTNDGNRYFKAAGRRQKDQTC